MDVLCVRVRFVNSVFRGARNVCRGGAERGGGALSRDHVQRYDVQFASVTCSNRIMRTLRKRRNGRGLGGNGSGARKEVRSGARRVVRDASVRCTQAGATCIKATRRRSACDANGDTRTSWRGDSRRDASQNRIRRWLLRGSCGSQSTMKHRTTSAFAWTRRLWHIRGIGTACNRARRGRNIEPLRRRSWTRSRSSFGTIHRKRRQ